MISLIDYAAANARFSLPTWVADDTKKERLMFLLHEGDAELNEHLRLDWQAFSYAHWCQACALPREKIDEAAGLSLFGLIVTGNLTVHGSILNTNGDGGPLLLVQGNCRAKNLVAGGSAIIIDGDAHIAGATYAFYNHGEVKIWGALHAPMFINDDHCFSVGMHNAPQEQHIQCTYIHDDDDDYIDDDDAIPAKLKKLVSPRLQLWGDILPALRRGEEVLKQAGEQTPTRIEDWVPLVWKNPLALKKVPKSLRTSAFYQALFAEGTPLDRFEVLEIMGQIPLAALTQEVIIAALQLSPKSLLRLPPSFDLAQWYEQCFLRVAQPQKIFDDIPEQFRSPAMQAYRDKSGT